MDDMEKFDEMSEFYGQGQLRSNIEDPLSKTYGDRMFEQYELLADYNPENDIPIDDLLPHDTRVTQSLSDEDEDDQITTPESEVHEIEDITASEISDEEPFPDVPDADVIQPGSPVDPASPPVDAMHGTDLLNGSADSD